MKNLKWGLGVGFIIFISTILFLDIRFKENKVDIDIAYKDKNKEEKIEFNNPLNDNRIIDNEAIYEFDNDSHVDKIYITILQSSTEKSITFNELNQIKNENINYTSDANDDFVEIHFYTDKHDYKNDLVSYNATLELRGQSSRNEPQKSYKIKLFDETDKWNGFSTINLNKHYSDSLRIRNKLSFDYFEIIPDLISLRTRFVKLYIKDVNDEVYKNYGLYTFIEQPNKRFLKKHNLDFNGNLYKAEFFEFFRYPNNLRTKKDIRFDELKFEEILEVNGNENHKKLIEMLDDLNDYSKNINDVIDKHFNKDNLLTWLGVNILFDNYDTNSRNFLLYSPLNAEEWYFIPWDYDKVLEINKYRGKWEKGLSNYWGMVIFNRYFKYKSNVDELSKKIEDLSEVINEENTNKFLESYYNVVKENLFIKPDSDFLNVSLSKYNKEYFSLSDMIEENKKYYYDSLENPMPFFLGEPKKEKDKYYFNWESSFDIQEDNINYTFLLSGDYDFNNLIIKQENLRKTNIVINDLKSGEYYWKVIAYDSKGNYQEAFDYYSESGIETKYGVKKFNVK